MTFNYDRMIESALRSLGVTIEGIPQYIAGSAFKLFKLHGSIHWGREVDEPVIDVDDRNVWEVGRELIRRAAELGTSAAGWALA